jgi:eukaryotic-like serine/threonine-protein kinase
MSSLGAVVFAGRYRVVRRLGAGAGGAVFLARDEVLGREVAVKRLHGAEVTVETAQRLRREARITASLRHPGLVTVYDMLMDGDELLLVMEYVAGTTLADVFASAPLAWKRTAQLLDPVAAALDHVHGHGVVHRDLKPANILVGSTGAVKIADLGLATAAEITQITPPGTVLGTPAYMAPEQARATPCTAAVDVYALATIVFQALSGTLPRVGTTVVAILRQAESEPPPDLRERRPETPAAAAQALIRAMSAWAGERQPSASALMRDLHVAFSGARPSLSPPDPPRPVADDRAHAAPRRRSPPAAKPPRTPDRRRRRQVRALALTALLAAVATVLILFAALSRSPTSPPGSTSSHGTPPRRPAATATVAGPKRLSATATVEAFYRRAAAGHFAAAWRLAGPAMRTAFDNSISRFRSDLSSLRHVEFRRIATIDRSGASATVAIQTVATHADHTERCTGTLRAIRGADDRWLVEPAGIQCSNE